MVTAARIRRARVAYLRGDVDEARAEVLATFQIDRYEAAVWDAFATLCADTDFDPTEALALVPDDRTFEVMTSLRDSKPEGVDRVAEVIWARNPEDARVLSMVPTFAAQLDCARASVWSARMRRIGMGRTCPLSARAEDRSVDAMERVRACTLMHSTFGDRRARDLLERAVPGLSDHEIAPAVHEVLTTAAALADSAVATGASTPVRSLAIATALLERGAPHEAYLVLVHGLSLEAAEFLTTDEVARLLPMPVLYGLAAEAEERGDEVLAGVLEAVATIAGVRR